MFTAALIASLCVHLPVYKVLGTLADVLLAERPAPAEPTTIEFEVAAAPEADPSPSEPEALPKRPTPPPPPAPQPARAQSKQRPRPKQPKPVKVVEVEPTPEPPKVQPPPEEQPERLAVTQKSDNPDVQPPPDAQFIAEENRRVDEQTVARLRNMQVDETPEPTAAAESDDSVTHAGDAMDTKVADLKEQTGSDDRAATPKEAQARKRPHTPSAGDVDAPSERQSKPVAVPQPRPEVASGGPKLAGEQEPLVIHDGLGTVAIKRTTPASGAASDGRQGAARRPASSQGGQRRTGGQGVDLRVSWNQFEQTFGSEELTRQREAAQVAQRRSRLRGSGRGQRWRKFKAAIENFVPNVKPGNQTALNAAADPFAHYLATIHRSIHREFAMGFLRNLPMGGGAFDDNSLRTKLEISINRDGSLHKVGVVRTSGFLPFDYGAFDAVVRAGPFATPPRKILSGDGRVYVHWGFYRNHRQCGTFNASMYILNGPQGQPPVTPSGSDPAGSEFGHHDHHNDHDHHHDHDGDPSGQGHAWAAPNR